MRNTKTHALIMHASLQGDYHKRITALSPRLGLFYCTAYGAYKSKSRMVSSTDPYREVVFDLYYNPVKDQYKVNEVEIVKSFDSVRGSIEKILAAGLVCEIVQKTWGGDESMAVYRLLSATLSILDGCQTCNVRYVLYQFVLRYLLESGLFALPEYCDHCGGSFVQGRAMFWTGREGEFICDKCNHPSDAVLSPGGFAYIRNTMGMTIEAACMTRTDVSTGESLKTFLVVFMEQSTGYRTVSPWP